MAWILKQLRELKGQTIDNMALLLDMEQNEYAYCENHPFEFELTQAYEISRILEIDFNEINWTEDIEAELDRRKQNQHIEIPVEVLHFCFSLCQATPLTPDLHLTIFLALESKH